MDFAWKYVDAFYTACLTFGPYVDPVPVDDAMVLNCGEMELTTGSLGYYHIEWKLDSPTQDAQTVFTSGVTSDLGEVQAQHPFTNEVVQAGELYPVIKYIYIDGIRYSAYRDDIGRWSPDLLTCLDPVTITPITCSTSYGGDPVYQYKLVYRNTTDRGLNKSRVLVFERCPDMDYLAWSFQAWQVSEQIQFYYCTDVDDPGTLVDNFIMGWRNAGGGTLAINLYPVSYPTNPRIYNTSNTSVPLQFITDLTGFPYVAGDFVKVVITGSVYEPSITNTDWDIKLQYLTEDDIDGSFYDTDISKITDTPVMNYTSDPGCVYDVSYTALVNPGVQSKTTSPYMIYKYTQLRTGYGSNAYYSNYNLTSPIHTSCKWANTASGSWIWYGPGIYTLRNLDPGESVSCVKDTSNITFTYSDVDDYDKAKANIASIQASAGYTLWLTLDNTDYRYFAFYYINFIVGESIGDSTFPHFMYIHLSSTITYNDTNRTIDFTIVIPTNNVVDESCDEKHEIADTYISYMNGTKNLVLGVDHDHSHIMYTDPIAAQTAITGVNHATTATQSVYFLVEEVLLNGLFDLTPLGFCEQSTCVQPTSTSDTFYLWRCYDRLTLTDTTDHASRLANWRLERKIGLRTDDCADYDAGDWEIVHEEP